ncbi:MAG TPA: O-antigen ligase family protein [Solirubrobacterales bacterium]|nr:O-antigen ligase family protein [Solirubrobacterales bacterium]
MLAMSPIRRLSAAPVELLAGAACALALGAAVAAGTGTALALVGLVAALVLYVSLANRVGIVLALLLPASLAGLLVPYAVSVAVQAGLALVVIGSTAWAFAKREPTAWGALALLAVVGLWVLLAFHPNVPSLSVGLLGVRKTTFFLLGLALGLVWPGRSAEGGERALIKLLLLVALATVAVHAFLPDLESSFERGASVYTEEFAGHARVSGFFSGPFHVSLLGTFLVLWAWHGYLSKAESGRVLAACLAAGLLLVDLSGVRTGYATIGLGVALTLLLRPSTRASKLRVVALTGLLAIAVGVLLSTSLVRDPALSSLGHLSGDSRVASRLETISESERMIGESPLIGWGAGSAGSTLGADFFLGRHVTSHDMALGFLVEGGFLGLALVGVALFVALWGSRGLLSLRHPAAAAALSLIGFAIAGDVSEALPVSFFLMAFIGLRARSLRLVGPAGT